MKLGQIQLAAHLPMRLASKGPAVAAADGVGRVGVDVADTLSSCGLGHNTPLTVLEKAAGNRGAVGVELQMVDLKDPDHWRWRLHDRQGNFVVGHQVVLLFGEKVHSRFADLAGFLQDCAECDGRLRGETELAERVGRWIGAQVVGEHRTLAAVRGW